MRPIALSIIFTLVLFGSFNFVHAQSIRTVEDSDIVVKLNPEVPGAQERVTITLESYVTDLNRAHISWQKNGKQDLLGYGKKQFSFTTGSIGETIIITVNIATESGEILNKRIVVNPAEIDLLWEGADSYTPPFYRGRALPSKEGLVRVVAMPQIKQGGALLDAGNYVFTWKRQDKTIQSGSGFGKNTFVFQKDYLNPSESIEVTAQNNQTGSRSQARLSLAAFQPKIMFYEKNPLLGVQFQTALANDFKVQASDKTVVAIPYFISSTNPVSGDLLYEWSINGSRIPQPGVKNVLTIRRGQQSGVALIKLQITSLNKLFLDASTQIRASLQ